MKKINTRILKAVCLYSLVNNKEAFIYQYSNGTICFGNLKTLSHILHIDKYVKVMYNTYRIKNSHYICIVDMNTGNILGCYDTLNREFCKD